MTSDYSPPPDYSRTILDFLGMLAGLEPRDRGMAGFVLRHGSFHVPAPLTARLPRLVPKACFANSQKTVARAVAAGKEPLTYCEGFACSGSLSVMYPIHHAWLIDGEGRVVDRTWEFPEASVYFGVAFSTDYVMSRSGARIGFDSLLDDRRDDWALLRDADIASGAVVSAAGGNGRAAAWLRPRP